MAFDPDAPAEPGSLFGLPHDPDDALVHVLPVPFEATTSYRAGTARGPRGVVDASAQVDLFDSRWGDAWRRGIVLEGTPFGFEELDELARRGVQEVRSGGTSEAPEGCGARVVGLVRKWTADQLGRGHIPAVLGGEHSVALGALLAASDGTEVGVLQIDAHADLRPAYEGLRYSHASVMHNLLEARPDLCLVQVGVRDLGQVEYDRIRVDDRIHCFGDGAIGDRLAVGTSWARLVEDMLAPLPERVWVSFDVDGLEPALCPGTGTPVPGGLSWREVCFLLSALVDSGRQIAGFDLCEVGPTELDAIVGARLLYQLACASIASSVTGGSDEGP